MIVINCFYFQKLRESLESGDSSSTIAESLLNAREDLKTILFAYPLEFIINCDIC